VGGVPRDGASNEALSGGAEERGETMKRATTVTSFALALAIAAVAAAFFVVPALAGNGATITNTAAKPIPGLVGSDFYFWNGDGVVQDFAPTYYQEVMTPSGVHNEVLKGVVANSTGLPVVYTATSGGPIPAGQGCWDFANGRTSQDWQMTIDASGQYTLNCHFAA
jgi:hypothetical protein